MQIIVGPFTYVQLVSTRGGTAPLLSDSVDLPTGLVWTSPFSGIFWFYMPHDGENMELNVASSSSSQSDTN